MGSEPRHFEVPLTERSKDLLLRAEGFGVVIRDLQYFKQLLDRMIGEDIGRLFPRDDRGGLRTDAMFRDIVKHIQAFAPSEPCGSCMQCQHTAECKLCKGLGVISKFLAENAIPSDMRIRRNGKR